MSNQLLNAATEFDPLVSCFPDAWETLPKDIHASVFFAGIKTGIHKRLVSEIRERFATARLRGVPYAKAKSVVEKQKKKLPSVSVAGVLPMRNKEMKPQFTGLLQADLDLLGNRLGEIRDTLRADPHVCCLFVSPTGEGLKAIYRVPICETESQYLDAFAAVSSRVEDLTGIAIDELKDFTRLCFASDDPDAYINPNVIELPVLHTVAAEQTTNAAPGQPANKPTPRTLTAPHSGESRRSVAERLLGAVEWENDVLGHCRCPGETHHTSGDNHKDCRIYLDGAPTLKCVHQSCKATVDDTNHRLRSEVGKAEWKPQDAPSVADPEAEQTTDANHFKNDVGYADAFVKRFSKSIRYVTDEATWLVFSESHGWRRDASGEISSLFADYARELYRDALIKAATLDPDAGKRLIANAVSLGNRKRISPAISFAESNRAVAVLAEQLDADKLLVGVRNGVVNLADGSFQPHSREHLVTRRLDVTFDATATAPTFERFLAEVQPEADMRGFLQRLSGYWLTGETREHILPFHYGTGANGKGTFLEQVTLKMFGNYGAKLTDSLVYASDRGALPHLELANLCGKRFTLGEENAKGGNLNERLLKAITGSDRVKGRFHYANFVEYFPTYKITLVGNHKPRIDGTDEGIWRRFLLVDWKVQIPPEQRDAKLSEKLAAEMPGILNWCIAGAIDWERTGLNPPESCRAATAAFREKSDALVEFVAECFVADQDGYCTKSEAFTSYTRWAERQGINHPMSKRALGFQLVNRGWTEGRASHENSHCWYGWRASNE